MILDISRKISFLFVLFLSNKLVANDHELISPGGQADELEKVQTKINNALPKTIGRQAAELFKKHKSAFKAAGGSIAITAAAGLLTLFVRNNKIKTEAYKKAQAERINAEILSLPDNEITIRQNKSEEEAVARQNILANKESKIRTLVEKEEAREFSKILTELISNLDEPKERKKISDEAEEISFTYFKSIQKFKDNVKRLTKSYYRALGRIISIDPLEYGLGILFDSKANVAINFSKDCQIKFMQALARVIATNRSRPFNTEQITKLREVLDEYKSSMESLNAKAAELDLAIKTKEKTAARAAARRIRYAKAVVSRGSQARASAARSEARASEERALDGNRPTKDSVQAAVKDAEALLTPIDSQVTPGSIGYTSEQQSPRARIPTNTGSVAAMPTRSPVRGLSQRPEINIMGKRQSTQRIDSANRNRSEIQA